MTESVEEKQTVCWWLVNFPGFPDEFVCQHDIFKTLSFLPYKDTSTLRCDGFHICSDAVVICSPPSVRCQASLPIPNTSSPLPLKPWPRRTPFSMCNRSHRCGDSY